MDFESLIPRSALVLELDGFVQSGRVDDLAHKKKLYRLIATQDTALEGLRIQADVILASISEVPDRLSEKLSIGGILILCLNKVEREDISINAELFVHRASSEVGDDTVSVFSRQ